MCAKRLVADVVSGIVVYDVKLNVNYTIYQKLLKALTNKDYIALKRYLHTSNSSLLSRYMRTSIRTLKKYLPYIKNSFHYPYNNGRVEGINNKIKVLNRVAYGYRKFSHFKKIILIHFKMKPSKQKVS